MNISFVEQPPAPDARPTVTILPESSGNLLCVAFSGLVTQSDHEKYLSDKVAEIFQRYGNFRLLFLYTADFQGWEHDAASINLETIMQFGKNAEKLAYVNPPEKKIFQLKLTPELFGGEVRFFNPEELQQAFDWIRE